MRTIHVLLTTLAVRSVMAQVSYLGQLSGPGSCGPYDAVSTPDGGQVLCGVFDDEVDLDPGPGVFTITSAGSSVAWVA